MNRKDPPPYADSSSSPTLPAGPSRMSHEQRPFQTRTEIVNDVIEGNGMEGNKQQMRCRMSKQSSK